MIIWATKIHLPNNHRGFNGEQERTISTYFYIEARGFIQWLVDADSIPEVLIIMAPTKPP